MKKSWLTVVLITCVATAVAAQTTEQTPAPAAAGTQTQPAAAPPTPPPPPPEPSFPSSVPKITAGYQEKSDQLIVARNYVDFTYERYRLQCDLLTYNPQTQELTAEGNVILEEGKQRLAGEKLHFSLKTKRGVMFDASGSADPDLNFVADELEKYDDRKYRSTNGEFTSCTQPNPRWKLSSSKADLEIDDHVTLKNAFFSVKSVPIFYLPYMRYPIRDDDRATGFLIPNYGQSDQKGTIFGAGFFWAINRSQDATFAYRSFSDLGRGIESEYRYIFSDSMLGNVNFFYMFEKGGKDTETGGTNIHNAQNVKGYFLSAQHRQILPFGVSNQTDITLLTTYAFKQIYGNNFQNISDPRKSSSTFFSKTFTYDTLNLNLRRDELLRGLKRHEETYYVKKKPKKRIWFTEDSDVANRLPEVSYSHSAQKLGASPILFSASASFIGYESYNRTTDTGTQETTITPRTNFTRMNWDPVVSVPITYLPWMTVTPSFRYSGAYWSDSYTLDTRKPGGGALFRNTAVTSVQIFGPNVNRIFSTPNLNFSKKWKHSIEPFIKLDHTTKFEDAFRLLPDSNDSIGAGGQQRITYTLTNTLYGKRTLVPGYDPVPVDIIRWQITQWYEPNSTYIDPETKKHTRWSDLNSQLTFKIAPVIDISFTTNYDFNWVRFVDYQLRGTLAQSDKYNASVGWTIEKNPKTGENSSNSLWMSGGFAIKRLGSRIDGQLAYTPSNEKDKLQNAMIRWTQNFQCWGVEVMYQRYKYYQQQENAFLFTVHIGSIGTISERIGGPQF